MTLPRHLDELTPQWLTEALAERSPDTVVDAVDVESVIWGTATKVFLTVGYADRPDGGPPDALCVKGGFQDELRAGWPGSATARRRRSTGTSPRSWTGCRCRRAGTPGWTSTATRAW